MSEGADISGRFWAKVDIPSRFSCWWWTGATTGSSGKYGWFAIVTWPMAEQRHTYAHRFAYEECVGPIPDGYQIDHLCLNLLCVNPSHLEAVTQQVNRRRQGLIGAAAVHAAAMTCNQGHPFDGYNGRQRTCSQCHRVRNQAYRERKRVGHG